MAVNSTKSTGTRYISSNCMLYNAHNLVINPLTLNNMKKDQPGRIGFFLFCKDRWRVVTIHTHVYIIEHMHVCRLIQFFVHCLLLDGYAGAAAAAFRYDSNELTNFRLTIKLMM